MFLAANFPSIDPGGSQEHISLITNSAFNDFAFLIQFQYKGYLNFCLYFISFSFTTGHFCMFIICKNTYYFPLQFLAQFSATMSSSMGLNLVVNVCKLMHSTVAHSTWARFIKKSLRTNLGKT